MGRNPLKESGNSGRIDENSRNHPGHTHKNSSWKRDREKMLLGNNGRSRPNQRPTCVYCNSYDHSSHNCTKVLDVAARRALIQRNGLCWNCTGTGHAASQCRSRGCWNCQAKHHTSICDKARSTVDLLPSSRVEKSMSSLMTQASTLHPTLLAKVGSETVRVMFDSGAGSSYVCTEVITKLNLRPSRKEQRCIEQMFGTTRRNVEVYSVTIESLAVEGFSLEVECINAEKDVLTHLPNPRIKALRAIFPENRKSQIARHS